MRVATAQEAIEGAPSIIQPDGNGGVIFALVTDEAVLKVVDRIVEENNWNDEERQNLYEAVLSVLDELIVEGPDGETP